MKNKGKNTQVTVVCNTSKPPKCNTVRNAVIKGVVAGIVGATIGVDVTGF